jgi:hypothetical protein
MTSDAFNKGLGTGLCIGLIAGVIMASLGSWFWQAYMHKRQFTRSSGKGAALREAGHSASDDEVWTRGGAR